MEPKVVIEVDGGQHAEQVSNDLQRTEYLKVLGYRVIRFWNHEVLGGPDAVLESIRAALVEIPSPPPSPGWERELTEYPYIVPKSHFFKREDTAEPVSCQTRGVMGVGHVARGIDVRVAGARGALIALSVAVFKLSETPA
ncbi:MAG: endonuclease domain-containing protein [Chromatiales bacterium]